MDIIRKSALAFTKDEAQRRREDRKRVFLPARLETASEGFDCRVLNLSSGGAKVGVMKPLVVGDTVTLVIGRVEVFEAVVVWQQPGSAGLRFLRHTKRESGDEHTSSIARASEHAAQGNESKIVSSSKGRHLDALASESALKDMTDRSSDGWSSIAKDEPRVVSEAAVVARTPNVESSEKLSPEKLARARGDNERIGGIVAQLQARVLEQIDAKRAIEVERSELLRAVEPLVAESVEEFGIQINRSEREAIVERIIDEMRGLGPLEPLLADETVNDILVNGPKRVYVEKEGKLVLTGCVFTDDRHVMNVASRIVTRVGRRIDETTPFVDARLPDGSRVNVVIPPLSIDGPMISIRKFSKKEITFPRMVSQGNMSEAMATVLKIAAHSRLNVLISGGTGSGKTTLLNAMSQMIDPAERVLTIEDAAELQLRQPHVGRLETRPANVEGKGEVTIRDLFKNALRMRPDRIIVGEIRGSEAFDMLQAMNSGHDGSLGTIHASGPREALIRLENIISMIGMNLTPRGARAQIASAIDMIVQISRMRDGKRRVTSIMEVVGMEGDVITTQELFQYRSTRQTPDGDLIGDFVSSGLRPHFMPEAEHYGLGVELIRAMA